MAKLAIFTPSYLGDFEAFRDLHESVVRFSEADVIHHVAVPGRDVRLFSTVASDRMRIIPKQDLLPRHFVTTFAIERMLQRIPRVGQRIPELEAVNLRRPWPPIRGWILQQIVKIAAVAGLDADVVLIVDSDVALIQPLVADDLYRDGAARFYRSSNVLTPDLTRHARWHTVSRRLLGLDDVDEHINADYVSGFVTWDPAVVRRMRSRVEQATGRHWADAIASQLHFSEYMLYGCYVERLGTDKDRSFREGDSLCHSYTGSVPLDARSADDFVAAIQHSDLAVQVQSRSNTPSTVRQRILEQATQRVRP